MTSLDADDIAAAHDIAAVVHRYATALDECDWTLLEEVFAEDAVYRIGGHGEVAGRGTIVARLEALVGHYDVTQHLVGNVVSEIDGRRGLATSHVRAHHRWADGDGGHTMEMGGVYRDELVRTALGWRISRRVLDVVWREGVARSAGRPTDPPRADLWPRG